MATVSHTRHPFFRKLGYCVLFPCFRSEKNQNLMREGEKNIKDKNQLSLFLEKLMMYQIKKTFDKFLEKLMRAMK